MRRRNGISLVELLVAMVIFVPMFVAITQSMSFVFEVTSEVTIRQIRLNQYTQIYHYLSRDLNQAHTIIVGDAPTRNWIEAHIRPDLRVQWVYAKVPGTLTRTAYDPIAVTNLQGPSQFMEEAQCVFSITGVQGESAVSVLVEETLANSFTLDFVVGGETSKQPTVRVP